MKTAIPFVIGLLFPLLACTAQDGGIEWIEGPAVASLGNLAEIDVPEGFVFTGKKGTQILMESMENPINGTELGFLAPSSIFDEGGENWFVVFEFDETGYVKDDQKADLDANAMLKSLKEANREGNKVRESRGWDTIELTGWVQPPYYNEKTNNLEWGTRIQDTHGEESINYNTRLLGRKGVMAVTLVTGPEEFEAIRDSYQTALTGFRYVKGERYAEWKQGDRIAQYGLTGLVVGGGAAVAAKTGLLAKFWKILIIPFLVAGAFLKKLFGGGKK